MILRVFVLVCLLFAWLSSAELHGKIPDHANRPNEKATRVSVTDESTVEIYQPISKSKMIIEILLSKWVDTGLSSIMSALANKKLKKHRREVISKFGECSHGADSVTKQAKCLSKLLNNQINVNKEDQKQQDPRLSRYGKQNPQEWQGSFRMRAKRQTASTRDNYDLREAKPMITPLGGVAKLIMESVLAAKNKTKAVPWQDTVLKLRENGARKIKMRKELEQDSEESMNQMVFGGIRKHLMKEQNGGFDADELLTNPDGMKDFLKKAQQKKNKKPIEKVFQLVKDGVKLGYSLSGQNTTNFENKTMKLFSPRFMGVVPEEKQEDELDFFSPSLFSLHDQGEGVENLTSLPNLLRSMSLKDQQYWLDLIMEASGVNEQSDKLETELNDFAQNKSRQVLDPSKLIDEDGIPMYFTKENATLIGGTFEERKIEVFEKLHKTYTKNQLREMNATGYTTLRKDQLFLLYGPQSPYNNSEALQRLSRLNESEMHDQIEKDVHKISEMEKFNVKQKDIVLAPISFTFLTLVPALASQPLILQSSYIQSFNLKSVHIWGCNFITLDVCAVGLVSTYPRRLNIVAFYPVSNHFDTSRFTSCHFESRCIQPSYSLAGSADAVFTPLVLSPLVLGPIILNPLAGSPLILSPFVLTPIIASPQFLGGLILSPYVLSPVLFSPLIAFAAVLSPSFLS
ncbi:hypothetical protein M3Y97_01017500 [Aphelenchoides bicaudatus]|nr:hypothetical protein M3Y97_01017500 [Aphelenchoides bicaudatus]